MGDCGGRVPGPSYALGNLTGYEKHDFTKLRAPAYSLGLKLKSVGDRSTSVGPYNVGQVDRFGKYSYLGWTMESKGGPGSNEKDEGPSPLSYSPEKIKPHSPAFSFGLKGQGIGKNATGPSPADYFYKYPPRSGFTIGHPYKNTDKFVSCGPQPAVPMEFFKPRAPAFSLGLKGTSIYNGNVGPGPKYLPKDLYVCQGFSFGMKHNKCSPPLFVYEDNN